MLTFRQLYEMQGKVLADNRPLAATVRIIEAATGHPLSAEPFPATITGYVKPQFKTGGNAAAEPPTGTRDAPNSRFVAKTPCTDPSDIQDCTDTSNDGFLPCGYYPVRYKWKTNIPGLGSDYLCGYRQKADLSWVTWRQAFYAVNTAHKTQDFLIDYAYTRNTLVQMAFGQIGFLTNNQPKFGFFFHHMTDAPGANFCSGAFGTGICGCCQWFDAVPPFGNYAECMSEIDCFTIHGDEGAEWSPGAHGSPAPCPGHGLCPENC